jgi:predicted transcriptional regulator
LVEDCADFHYPDPGRYVTYKYWNSNKRRTAREDERFMNVSDLLNIVDGKLLFPVLDLTREIKGGCGADLMSDVLASIQQPDGVLLTGLCNPQVVRTAAMADMAAIVLVRGKKPPIETVALAEKEGVPLISTPFGMFEICGKLHRAGLPSLEKPVPDESCSCD